MGPMPGTHLSHLPMTITSAILGSRAPGGLWSLGWPELPEAALAQMWEADQPTCSGFHLHGRGHTGSRCAWVCGAGPLLLLWPSHVLCKVLLKPIFCLEGQLPSFLSIQVHLHRRSLSLEHLSEFTWLLLPSFRLQEASPDLRT